MAITCCDSWVNHPRDAGQRHDKHDVIVNTSSWYMRQSSLCGTWYCIGASSTHLESNLLSPPRTTTLGVSFTHTTRGTPLNSKLTLVVHKTNTFPYWHSRECCQYPRTPAGSPGSSRSRSLQEATPFHATSAKQNIFRSNQVAVVVLKRTTTQSKNKEADRRARVPRRETPLYMASHYSSARRHILPRQHTNNTANSHPEEYPRQSKDMSQTNLPRSWRWQSSVADSLRSGACEPASKPPRLRAYARPRHKPHARFRSEKDDKSSKTVRIRTHL